jgi:hypothetical protein
MPSYEYKYENSKESLKEVEEALKSEYRSPDFARNVEVALTTTLSEASVSIHLRELVERDRAVKVGKTYIHVDNIEKQEVWQLERVLDRLDNKNTIAEKIQQRLEKKIELRKEQFQELKDELSFRQTDKEIEEINSLMDSRNYYEEKQRQLKKDIRKVFGMIDFVKNPNSKESCDVQGFPIQESDRVLA